MCEPFPLHMWWNCISIKNRLIIRTCSPQQNRRRAHTRTLSPSLSLSHTYILSRFRPYTESSFILHRNLHSKRNKFWKKRNEGKKERHTKYLHTWHACRKCEHIKLSTPLLFLYFSLKKRWKARQGHVSCSSGSNDSQQLWLIKLEMK